MPSKKDLETWRGSVKRGLSAQKEYGHSDDWETFEKHYLGNYGATLPMNYTFGLARALIPQTYFRNPAISIVPRRPGMEENALVLESVVNWLISEMGLKAQLKRVLLDVFLYGTGVIKLGYDSQYGFDPEMMQGPVMLPDGQVADLSDETLSSRQTRGARGKFMENIEYHANVQPGMPWALRIHPREFVLDPAATCIEDAQWCAHRILRKLGDVKADPKYTGTSDLTPSHSEEFRSVDDARMIRADQFSGSAGDPSALRPQPERYDDWVELWEIHDRKTEQILVMTMNHERFLRVDHDELQIDGLPFVSLQFSPNPRTFWGVPDARVIQPQQLELNEVRQRQQNYRRLGILRWLIDANAVVEDSELEKLLTSEDPMVFAKIKGETGKGLRELVQQLPSYMPPDMTAWSKEIIGDMEALVGMGKNQLGEYDKGAFGGSGRRTATEANIVQQNSQLRVDERRDIVADALALIARRVSQMVFKFWTTERVARVAGEQGAYNWIQYTGEQLRGEYDFKIDPDDALPMTRDRRRMEALQLYQATAGNPVVNPVEALRHLLKQFEGINPDMFINQLAAAMLQMQQQQMLAQAQAGQTGSPGAPGPEGAPAPTQGAAGGGGANVPAGMPAMQ